MYEVRHLADGVSQLMGIYTFVSAAGRKGLRGLSGRAWGLCTRLEDRPVIARGLTQPNPLALAMPPPHRHAQTFGADGSQVQARFSYTYKRQEIDGRW
jgi:hypothetical protein